MDVVIYNKDWGDFVDLSLLIYMRFRIDVEINGIVEVSFEGLVGVVK